MLKKPKPTRSGWIALAISILTTAALIGFFLVVDTGLPTPIIEIFYIGVFFGLPLSIALDIFAGTRGFGNRVLGLIGGTILISPLLYVLVVTTFTFWLP